METQTQIQKEYLGYDVSEIEETYMFIKEGEFEKVKIPLRVLKSYDLKKFNQVRFCDLRRNLYKIPEVKLKALEYQRKHRRNETAKTKKKRLEYQKKYYQNPINKVKLKKYAKEWAKKPNSKELVRKSARKYYSKNKELINKKRKDRLTPEKIEENKQRARNYYYKNIETINKKAKKNYQLKKQNPILMDKLKKRSNEYYHKNKEKLNKKAREKYAKKVQKS